MSETYSSSKRIPQHNSNSKIPFQFKKIEGIQKVKASNEIMKRLVDSKRIDKILNKNKDLFDYHTLNNTIDSRNNDESCYNYKSYQNESFKLNERNLSMNQDKKNSFYKELSRDEFDSATVLNTSHNKQMPNKPKPIRIQKVIPKIDFPLTKPLKLNLSLSKQKDRVKDSIIQEIKKMNSSLDATHKNGNTIINIHNNINIKIKDSKIPIDNPLKATRNKNSESINTKSINANDFSIKFSPNKTIQEKIKTNNYMTEQKSVSKKSHVPSLKLNSKNLLNTNIPLKLVNINPKVIKLSSLLKKKNNNTNISSSKIELNHNENSIISFDESLISKRKKDSNPSQEKHERNEEISLSYSEDEKTNKPIRTKTHDKTVKKMVHSFEGDEEASDNEKEFLKFCENLNKKILNK